MKYSGNTYQDGTPTPQNVTGNANVKIQNKNLAWNGWAEDFVNRINNNSKARIEIKDNRNCLHYGASAGYGDYDNNYIFKILFKANTQYTFVFDMFTEINTGNIAIQYVDNTSTVLSNIEVNKWNKVVLSSVANKTIKYLRVSYNNGGSDIDLDTFMVLEGAYTAETIPSYVPHQEQNYPFSLRSKNLLNINRQLGEPSNTDFANTTKRFFNYDTYVKGITGANNYSSSSVKDVVIEDNNVSFTAVAGYYGLGFPIKVKPNTNYCFSVTETLSTSVVRIMFYDKDGTYLSNVNKGSFITPSNCDFILVFLTGSQANTTYNFSNIQIEEGTEATDYEPYYDVKAMQGTTLQDDGIHNVRKQIVLTGNEYFLGTDPFYVLIQGIKRSDAEIIVISNYFKGISFNNRLAEGNSNNVYSDGTYIFFRFTDFNNINEFKEFLATQYANGTPVIVEYKLAEEEIVPYKGVQQSEHNAMKQASAYNDVTYISGSSDELSPIYKVQYWEKV